MIGIYKITNKINNLSYIGQSTQIEQRFREHKKSYNWYREKNKKLYKDILEYGIDNFSFEILEECSIEELNDKEQYYIKYYNTYPDQYNMAPGGQFNAEESHPSHKLTKQDVIDIRTRYAKLEKRGSVYEDYKDKISISGFTKI